MLEGASPYPEKYFLWMDLSEVRSTQEINGFIHIYLFVCLTYDTFDNGLIYVCTLGRFIVISHTTVTLSDQTSFSWALNLFRKTKRYFREKVCSNTELRKISLELVSYSIRHLLVMGPSDDFFARLGAFLLLLGNVANNTWPGSDPLLNWLWLAWEISAWTHH